MFFLIVAILLAGTPIPQSPVVYKVQTWKTQAECDAFVASDAGKASLDGLRAFVNEQVAPGATLVPTCTDKPPVA
jgi:hypothetical protein